MSMQVIVSSPDSEYFGTEFLGIKNSKFELTLPGDKRILVKIQEQNIYIAWLIT